MPNTNNQAMADARQRFQELASEYRPQPVKATAVNKLISQKNAIAIDEFDSLIEELFEIDNPAANPADRGAYEAALKEYCQQYKSKSDGVWFYYPWRNCLIHLLETPDYQRLRSARNRNIITDTEQRRMRSAQVGVAGLSVGSSAVTALALTGMGNLRIADADTLALSNLNRIISGVHSLGLPKTTISARGVYELDPYASLEVFGDGLSEDNIEKFISGLDVLIDEIDDVSVKARLRLAARQKGIPVLMATDNGDNVLIDIERYDLDKSVEIFHGLLTKDDVQRVLAGGLSRQEWMMYAQKVIDIRHAPVRLLRSVPLIGRELAGIPQIGSTAMFAGAVLAYTTRLILNGEPARHGKFHVNLEAIIREDYQELEKQQKQLLENLNKVMGA